MKTKQIVLAVLAFILAAAIMPFAASAIPYDKTGSILLFPAFSSDTADLTIENTKISLVNTNNAFAVNVSCAIFYQNASAEFNRTSYNVSLSPNQLENFYIGDILTGDMQGFIVCAAIDSSGDIMQFDYLTGHAWLKTGDNEAGMYNALTYYMTTAESLLNDGKIEIGTSNVLPGAPSSTYLSSFSAYNDGYRSYFYTASSLNPAATPPANDALVGSANDVKNDMVLFMYDDATWGITLYNLGNLSEKFTLDNDFMPFFTMLVSSGRSGWIEIIQNPLSEIGATFGNIPGVVFTSYNLYGGSNFLYALNRAHKSAVEAPAYLPFMEIVTADVVAPTVQFVSPTTASGTYSQSYIVANVTAKDKNLDTITLDLYNSTGLVHSQTSGTSPLFHNFTGLADGTYYLNATANDTVSQTNSTETRTIVLNTTQPSSAGAPAAGGGTPSAGTITYEAPVVEGETQIVTLSTGDTATITVEGESHGVRVAEVTPNYVTVDIMSPLRITLGLGEVRDVDVTENGINDLRVELLQIILPNGAKLKLTPLVEKTPEAPAVEEAPLAPTPTKISAPTAMFSIQGGSLTMFVIILLLAAIAYVSWRESKHMHSSIRRGKYK